MHVNADSIRRSEETFIIGHQPVAKLFRSEYASQKKSDVQPPEDKIKARPRRHCRVAILAARAAHPAAKIAALHAGNEPHGGAG
jgi:hypothetical protein